MVSVVPSTMLTVGGGCGTAETVGSAGGGIGPPANKGVTVVVIASSFVPAAGGCTTVVVVVPLLSTETTCCACPVVAACFLARSSALSCFDAHPDRMDTTNSRTSIGIRRAQIYELSLSMVDPLSHVSSCNADSKFCISGLR